MKTIDIERSVIKSQVESIMARYVQGVDRKDVDLLKSCYHPDAFEFHHTFNGNAHDFAEWRARQSFRTHHMLSTSAVELRGTRAFAETPHTAVVHVDIDEQGWCGVAEVATAGWYLDLFSQRDGEWKIDFQRVVTFSTSMRFLDGNRGLSARNGSAAGGADPFELGFALADDRPPPSHAEDAAARIRQAFLAQYGGRVERA